MLKKLFFSLGLFAALFIFSPNAFAQTTGVDPEPMSGRVTNSSGMGISKARIDVSAEGCVFQWPGASGLTNAFGYYLTQAKGDCNNFVRVSAKGYASQVRFLDLGGPFVNVDFVLEPL